jgi:hypothetical protein
MKCSVDGAIFDAAQLIYRDQGYGSDPGVPLSKYELAVEDQEILRRFGPVFEEFVAQCKSDDEGANGDSDIPDLKSLGYPTLAQMLASHRAIFAVLLKDYLYFQFLEALLGGNQRASWRFALNEINKISDKGDGYVLSGDGYFI